MRSSSSRLKRHQTNALLRRCLLPARNAYQDLQSRRTRCAIDTYLKRVYSAYVETERHRLAKNLTSFALSENRVSLRKATHPIRVIIETTSDESDNRVKSRWCRALEYAHHHETPPTRLRKFFRRNGGIAGCARCAAEELPKRETTGTWDE